MGTVISIENPPSEDENESGVSRYWFHVDERISGKLQNQVDVYSGRGGADCSYHFKQGEQYLVFPYRNDQGPLVATICSNTRPMDYAQALLPQLRAMRDRNPVASLFGTLRPFDRLSDDSDEKPIANARVQIQSGDLAFHAVTDQDGTYSFYYLPEGDYHFSAELPPHWELENGIWDGELPAVKLPAEACYEYNLYAEPAGRIKGRVVGQDGKPPLSAPVELFRVGRYTESEGGWWECQGENGFFEFNHVPAGQYLLVFNNSNQLDSDGPYPRTFYPGVVSLAAATPIVLQEGEQKLDADIHVSGGRPTRQITVRLTWVGTPHSDLAYVEAKGSDGDRPSAHKLSPGVFKLNLFKGVDYSVSGSEFCLNEDESASRAREALTQTITIDGSDDQTSEVTLTFAAGGCND